MRDTVVENPRTKPRLPRDIRSPACHPTSFELVGERQFSIFLHPSIFGTLLTVFTMTQLLGKFLLVLLLVLPSTLLFAGNGE